MKREESKWKSELRPKKMRIGGWCWLGLEALTEEPSLDYLVALRQQCFSFAEKIQSAILKQMRKEEREHQTNENNEEE